MDINTNRQSLEPNAAQLYDLFEQCHQQLEKAIIFFDFPIYKDFDGDAIAVQSLLISPKYGVIIFAASNSSVEDNALVESLNQVASLIYAKLLKNRLLRSDRFQLKIKISCLIFSPIPRKDMGFIDDQDFVLIKNQKNFIDFCDSVESQELDDTLFSELVATLDGSKGLIRPKVRIQERDTGNKTKAFYIKLLEDEISLFDNRQRYGFVVPANGPQRIRGIAGTGKTVVLTMKAAITHLRYPNAEIVYTFYTKSLYQHIKRLITRFYRQFDDKDPDWNKLRVMHAWGGRSYNGVYYDICLEHSVKPLTYSDRKSEARQKNKSVFDVVCTELNSSNLNLCEIHDFVFIDEGQDLPASFIDLCRRVTKDGKITWAYDELQNIFNIKIPSQEEVFGQDSDGNAIAQIVQDVVLYKSYRNPREILITAHALGFGIYDRIVQMFENKEHWEDIGYQVTKGNCKSGEPTEVKRPLNNTTKAISDNYGFQDIVRCKAFKNLQEEANYVSTEIIKDIQEEGLKPDDILVTVLDSRYLKNYANLIESNLNESGINANNTIQDFYGITDFYLENSVTISTINKAKGNESYHVYIVGIDEIFKRPDITNRNRIFTAMTRAKAWVTITGVGTNAEKCLREIQSVQDNFPKLNFIYPSQEDIMTVRRDMSNEAKKRQNSERAIDEALKNMSPEEIKNYIAQVTK